MRKVRIGLLTIGQSPRTDVTEDLNRVLVGGLEIVERGALDGLTAKAIEERFRPGPDDTVYVTRLRDGTEVEVAKEKVVPLMQEKIEELESEGVDAIVILCSGEFPEFRSSVPVVYPDKLLKGFASAVSARGPVAVLIPLAKQAGYAKAKWSRYYRQLIVESVSPYSAGEAEFRGVARRLAAERVSMTVMDCVGYTFRHKRIVAGITGKPVVATRGVVAAAINELVRELVG